MALNAKNFIHQYYLQKSMQKYYTQKKIVNIQYNIAWLGRAIQGNIPFQIDRIGLTEGRDDTEVENGIFPRIARPEELQ